MRKSGSLLTDFPGISPLILKRLYSGETAYHITVPGVTVALKPLRFTKKSKFQANEPRYMVCGDVNLITSSECYWCQIISLSAWGLPDRAPLLYVCCWWNLICCHLCWWGQFPWADPDAVFCRRDEDEKKTSTASGFFQQIWAVLHLSYVKKNPGMVPHASCYFVWLHAATALQSEVREKCDPKWVKGQAATAETFCSDIKLKAQSH